MEESVRLLIFILYGVSMVMEPNFASRRRKELNTSMSFSFGVRLPRNLKTYVENGSRETGVSLWFSFWIFSATVGIIIRIACRQGVLPSSLWHCQLHALYGFV